MDGRVKFEKLVASCTGGSNGREGGREIQIVVRHSVLTGGPILISSM